MAADVLAALAYQPVVLAHAGFAPTPPKAEDARQGYHDPTLAVTSRVLELWVEGYWVEAGDRVRFAITGPDGAPVLAHTVEVEQGFARWFQFVGARRPGDAWPAGTYRGEVTLQRDGLDAGQPGARGRAALTRLRTAGRRPAPGGRRHQHDAALGVGKAQHQHLGHDAGDLAWAGS